MADRVRVGTVADFPPGELRVVDANGTSVIVARADDSDDSLCAARNRCPHMGLPLDRGPGGLRFEGGVVQCPWHNSRFELCSGANLDWAVGFAGRSIPRWSQKLVALGKDPSPLTIYSVVVEGDDVFVEM